MNREEVIKLISNGNSYKFHSIKEEVINELKEIYFQEGTGLGEQAICTLEMWERLQPDYCSDELSNTLYEEIINLYITMLEHSELVEYPEETKTITYPARKEREWVY